MVQIDEDCDVEAVMDALLAKRIEMDVVGPSPHKHFAVGLRGGQWQEKCTTARTSTPSEQRLAMWQCSYGAKRRA